MSDKKDKDTKLADYLAALPVGHPDLGGFSPKVAAALAHMDATDSDPEPEDDDPMAAWNAGAIIDP